MPNIPVEFGAGVICVAAESDAAPELTTLLERLGAGRAPAGGSISSWPPRSVAARRRSSRCSRSDLIAAAVARGMSTSRARQIVNQTLLRNRQSCSTPTASTPARDDRRRIARRSDRDGAAEL